ncbi:MAG: 50S ribosomal protein L9 [Eubacterium sp.]|nr:50S ribosomal protein L9 [Eubacterium sp.]
MKVILLEDVKSLGKKGEIVEVNDGYARNFILPKKKGVEADSKNLNDLKLQKKNDAKVAQEKLDDAKALSEELATKSITIKMDAGVEGKLFGSISTKDVANEAKKQLDLEFDKKKVVLPENIKQLGTYDVKIKLHPEVQATLTIKVVAK